MTSSVTNGLRLTSAENSENDFSSLVVATLINGNLRSIGRVSEGFGPLDRHLIMYRARSLVTGTPIVSSNESAIWLRSVLAVRVSHKPVSDGVAPSGLRFVKMLADLDPGRP